jgi:ABC-type multidrug transport system ATPase subunit
MLVELRGVLKSYDQTRALNRVNMEIAPGQIVSLLGPNGAGKTTLLRCLAGIVSPDAGEVTFDGEAFHRERLDLRRRLMFLPDFPFLFWEHTALRNLSIILRLFEADKPGVEQRVADLLGEFDLLPLAGRPVSTLSRGQTYKVALVALIAADPELWLLDEPFASGMDPHGINAFKAHARQASARGRTVIYSTQLLDVAERFADRVCVIHQGDVHAFDTLENLRQTAADKANVLEELFRNLKESSS